MVFKEGDFILVDYTATVKETGEVIETTREDVAKEKGVFDKEKTYEPMLVIIGEGRVVKGLEEALREMDVGEERKIEVPPEKAYGKRDPGKLRRMPMREFRRAGVDPVPGRVVEINGVPAVVRDVGGGRVLVDFNHPLAGKTIIYEVKVVSKIEDEADRVKALLKRRLKPSKPEEYHVELRKDEGEVVIVVPVDDMLKPDIQLAKRALARELFKYLDWCNKVVFKEMIESTEKKSEKKEEKAGAGEKKEQQAETGGPEGESSGPGEAKTI